MRFLALLLLLQGAPKHPPLVSSAADVARLPADTTELTLSRAKADTFGALARLVKLTSVTLHGPGSEVTDDAIAAFASLKRVTILHGDISDAALKHLAKAEHVDVEGGERLTDAGLKALSPALRSLSIAFCPLMTGGTLAGFKELRHLDIRSCDRFDPAGLKTLSEKLESLVVDGAPLTGAGFDRFKSLKSLSIGFTESFSDAALTLPASLEILKLGFSPAGDAALAKASTCPNLRVVEAARTEITGAGLKAIASLPIEELSLGGCALGDGVHLARMKSLKVLRLHGATLDDFAKLAALTSLETLDLSDCAADDGDLKALGVLTKLKSLDLGKVKVSDAAIQAFRKAVPACTLRR